MGAGCDPQIEKTTCMKMAPGTLVSGAQAFKLEVYDESVTCDGNDTARFDDKATNSQTYQAGEPIKLSVPPGNHTLVLVAYSDAAATVPIGSSCQAEKLSAGGQLCYDFNVTALQEGCRHSSGRCCSSDDCMMPDGPAACFSGMCPAQGQSCAYTKKATATVCQDACCNAIGGGCNPDCSLTCSSDQANCNADTSDGCEVNLPSDAAHCGNCNRPCIADAFVDKASCSGSVCKSSCKTGHANCKTPAAPAVDDGCECNTPACCAGFCQQIHHDGFDHLFYDCFQVGIYTVDQANEAATKYNASGTVRPSMRQTDPGNGSNYVDAVCNLNSADCTCWAYNANGAYGSARGHALRTTPAVPPAAQSDCHLPITATGNPLWD
jgi:hypothetical protein